MQSSPDSSSPGWASRPRDGDGSGSHGWKAHFHPDPPPYPAARDRFNESDVLVDGDFSTRVEKMVSAIAVSPFPRGLPAAPLPITGPPLPRTSAKVR